MKPNKQIWSVDRIEAKEWRTPNGEAIVWASNWIQDEMNFCVMWHPDSFAIHYDVTRRFISSDLAPYQADLIIEEQLLDEVVRKLDSWWAQVQSLSAGLTSKEWKITRGLAAPEILYAKIALLYSLRAEFYPLMVVKLLAGDMSVPETTVKERLRKAKEKGFLTNPGKGLNGQGELTQKAIQLLKKEKML
jgi:hypothetical protein